MLSFFSDKIFFVSINKFISCEGLSEKSGVIHFKPFNLSSIWVAFSDKSKFTFDNSINSVVWGLILIKDPHGGLISSSLIFSPSEIATRNFDGYS